MARQATIRRTIEAVGIGSRFQRPVRVRFRPAPPATGVAFRRTDIGVCVAATLEVAGVCHNRLVLGRSPRHVEGVEHLLAAVVALGVTDLFIELDGPEPPAFEGGAATFLEMLSESGVAPGQQLVPAIHVHTAVRCEEGAATVELRAAGSLRIEARSAIGDVVAGVRLGVTPRAVASELAPACCPDAGARAGAGPTRRSTEVIERRRWSLPSEAIRHSALEVLGCLALLEYPLVAQVQVTAPSLTLTLAALRTLMAQPRAWELGVPGEPASLSTSRKWLDLHGVAAGVG